MQLRGAAILFCFLAWAGAAGADEIQWKFKEGETFWATETTDMKMEMSFMGQNQPMESKTVAVTKYTVKKANADGSVVLERKIESNKTEASVQAPGMDTEALAKKLEGATFVITLSPERKVTKIEGYEEFLKKLVGDDEMTAPFIKASLSEETIKRTIDELFLFVPGKAVSVGDTWKRDSVVPLGPLGSLKADTSYKFEGKADGLEKISYESKLTFEKPKADAANPAMPFKMVKADLKADKAKGVIKFDSAKGRLAQTEATVNMEMKMTIEAGGNEVDMEMRQEIKTSYKVSDTKPTS